ncbi:MAG: nitroreductase family protein [archaeon]|nr:nitroreductase family protein [archaeon]
MVDILDLIKSRRSIRSFIPKSVSWENLMKIVEAGQYAPSCGNLQNWKFIVIQDHSKKEKIVEACYEQYDFLAASAFIIICAELEKAERYYGLRGRRLYSVQNIAAATENMLLEAHSLGLGACWVGAFDEDVVKSILGIPNEVRPQAIIPVGYAAEMPKEPSKYPLSSLVYIERWRGTKTDSAKADHNYAEIISRKAESLVGSVKDTAIKRKEFVEDKLDQNSDEELQLSPKD